MLYTPTEVFFPSLVRCGRVEAGQVGLGGHEGPVHVCGPHVNLLLVILLTQVPAVPEYHQETIRYQLILDFYESYFALRLPVLLLSAHKENCLFKCSTGTGTDNFV